MHGSKRINYLVVVSDLHCGCRFGLCPAHAVKLDGGGSYEPSDIQRTVARWWMAFWTNWVPMATRGQEYAVVVNGDALEGVHHGAVTQVSHNHADQLAIAREMLTPIVKRCGGRFWMVRGTEAHVGPSAEVEEELAHDLGAQPDAHGHRTHYELWFQLGRGLIHAMHHIGTSGSMHYESTAVTRELVESYAEAGRWKNRPPDVVVRSHRHRNIEIRVPTSLAYGIAFTTPGWQLKTPFAYKIPGGRLSLPQIGGSIICQGDEDLYTRHRVWSIQRPKTVTL